MSRVDKEAKKTYDAEYRQRSTYKERRSAWYRNRRELLDEYKLERGCIDCGYVDHPAALDFDHVRGTKEFSVGHAITRLPMEKVWKEIEKCDIRCANCHRVRTAERRHA